MAFGSRLAGEWTCVSRVNGIMVFSALTRANFIILLLLPELVLLREVWDEAEPWGIQGDALQAG